MTALDPMLFEDGWKTRSSEMSSEAWLTLALQITGNLGANLKRRIGVDRGAALLDEGFSIDFRTEDADLAVWDLRARGTLGADVIGDRLLVRGWVFLYSGNSRIASEDSEYLEIELARENGEGVWRRVGWRRGEPGEFDSFSTFERRL